MSNFSKFLIITFLLFPAITFAADLYLEPSQAEYREDDVFIEKIRLNTEREYINAVDVILTFSADVLEVKDISKGNSILTLWVKEPEVKQQGVISFTGGVPAGYDGQDGLVAKIIFRAKSKGLAQIKFQETSQVLLNDGFGTKAQLETKGATLNILPKISVLSKDEWKGELSSDIIPPRPFTIYPQQDPLLFGGKWFIVFSTTDKQTGIKHFEVKEGEEVWRVVESPYLLEDQELKSIIKVKAVDKAGNERLAEYVPAKPFPYWVILLILVIGGVIWLIIRKSKIKK